MDINVILAQATNGAIGFNGKLPWGGFPEDMRHFRSVTGQDAVIMGRKTWNSIPKKFRPLPGRLNVVVTKNRDLLCQGAAVVHSLEQAIKFCSNFRQVWIIGGGELYKSALATLPVKSIYITQVLHEYQGDVFAPELDSTWKKFCVNGIDPGIQISKTGIRFQFQVFERRSF